jgi:hypothetical protein
MSTCTIYATIGNSDDRLGQARWSEFAAKFISVITDQADQVHGVWWSEPGAPWQNCCVGFAIAESGAGALRLSLSILRESYGQDAVAWVRGHPPEMI